MKQFAYSTTMIKKYKHFEHISSMSYIQHKPEGEPVFEFIEKKRSEGKRGKESMVAGMNKFLRIYYGKVTGLYRNLDL